MVAGIFTLGTPIWEIALRSAVVYLGVLAGFRLFGKREVGQLTLADLVLVILIANAVQNAMVGADTSLEGGLIAALVLLLVNLVIGYLRVASPLLDRAFEGHAIALVVRGEVIKEHLRREGLDEADLERVAHENQLKGLADVDSAWLESDGTISVVPRSNPPLRNSTYRPRSRRRAKGLRKPQT